MKSVVISIIACLACTTFACQPILRLYEADNEGEKLHEKFLVIDEFNMSSKGFNGETRDLYACVEGVWLGYQWEGYAGETLLISGRSGDLDKCSQVPSSSFRSVKAVGSSEDFTSNAVVTYYNSNNEWADTTYINNTAQLTNTRFNSLIIIGHSEVQLFAESNFQGTSICIRPNNGMIHTAEEFDAVNDRVDGTELYTDLTDLNAILNRVEFHSVKFGCE